MKTRDARSSNPNSVIWQTIRINFEVILKVIAIESIQPLALVSLLFNDSNQISCRKSLSSEPPDAIARRCISNGGSVMFDSGRDTDDLLRPRTAHYDPYPPSWLVNKRSCGDSRGISVSAANPKH